MKEAISYLRTVIINRLSSINYEGNPVVPYNRVPNDAVYPYIRVYSIGTDETDRNQTTYINEYITRVEVITRYESDNGGELDCNLIMSEVLQLLRTRSGGYFDLSGDGFNVYTSSSNGVLYFQEERQDHTYFRGVLELSNKIEQV